MTALAGFWSFGGVAGAEGNCDRMLAAQQVYAPDRPARWSDGSIAVGRRLFKLLPEDDFDRGPLVSGQRTLVADLRLDNREELCAALGIARNEAGRLADAALLMRALERWDLGALDRLTGDFAFALWDGAGGRLLLARDIVGHRPLHYHRGHGFFAFASMAKGLHALSAVPVAPNRRSAADFLLLMPGGGSESFFERFERVSPGHVAIVTRDSIVLRRYWNPPRREIRLKSAEEYREALREKLDMAVAAQLRGAAGHIAAQLSAGLDSSAVAATAARLLAREGGRVTAFTSVPRAGYQSGLRNVISDEGPLAASVAQLYPNMEHIRISAGAKSPLASLDRNFFLYEMPLLNLCNTVWIDAILDAARQRRLRIMLSGALGNMSFSYDGMPLLSKLLGQGRVLRLTREVYQLLRSGTRAGTIAAQTIGPFLPRPAWRMISRLRGKANDPTSYSAISRAAASGMEERAAARGLDLYYRPRSDSVASRLWAIGRLDSGNYYKGMLGGWGIDFRDPTADRRLLEFCLAVPDDQYLAGGLPRALARGAFADRLPQAVLGERRKGYQAADWHEGLSAARDQLREEIERLSATPVAADALDTKRMARLVEEWPDGAWHRDRTTASYRLALLRGISTGHFLRKAAGSNQ
jgi:asparagine synthase (glutamine-hydrolysing)